MLNQNSFQDVTDSAGIVWSRQTNNQSFSVAWLDFNNDDLLDLWISGHAYRGPVNGYPAKYPFLYINNGDGTFTNLFPEDWRRGSGGDTHGTTWSDFDNDGDQDVFVSVGAKLGQGEGSNLFFVNNNDQLQESASARGLEYSIGRGRSSLWFDGNGDGLLDVLLLEAVRPDGDGSTAFFRQKADGTFEDATDAVGLDIEKPSRYAQLADLTGDGKLDLVIQGTFTYPLKVYDISGSTFQDLTSSFPQISSGSPPEYLTNDFSDHKSARDTVIADFNNDLRPDIFIVRSKTSIRKSSIFQGGDKIVSADLVLQAGGEIGFNLTTSGDVAFDVSDTFGVYAKNKIEVSQIFIGASGRNPTAAELAAISASGSSTSVAAQITNTNGSGFVLSPTDSSVVGMPTPGDQRGLYIGYDTSTQTWQVRLSSPNNDSIRIVAESTENISNLTSVGFSTVDPSINALSDLFWIYDEATGEYVDGTVEAGLDSPTLAQSVVAGDFDNDMDLDLYLANAYSSFNQPNILYDNQGDGTFVAVSQAGGAAGTTVGPHTLDYGIGQRLTVADYDNDGFLDIFAGEATTMEFSRRKTYLGDPPQLFHNQGNDNHWLQIDLEGVESNRDGIGAQVFVTAGGVTQLREQNGGIHAFAQNDQRLHFGLADNTKVDEILVKWANGQEQKINNVPANQLLHIIEPSDSFAPGKPVYTVGSESGVFVWKDFFDGPYHLRTVGAEDPTQFVVNLISTDELQDVTPFSLETDDKLEETEFGFALDSQLVGWEDGVDFRLAPGAKALFSVTQDGVANPRQLNVGNEGTPLSPDGWIIDSDEFPSRPSFTAGEDLGLFVGTGATPEVLQFQWTGDRNFHRANLTAIASNSTASFSPVKLDLHDELTTLNNGVTIEGGVSTGLDGLDVTIAEPVQIGFAYEQDSLLPPHRVNPNLQDDLLKFPNAYWLPLATPYGQPEYDPSVNEGIFLWLDEQDFWHLRMTGSEEGSRYVGSIVSDQAAINVQTVKLEETDVVNTTDPLRIDFDFQVWQSWEDGLDFRFPEGAALTLNLEEPSEGASALLHVGAEQWSVSELPLDISGW